MKTGNAFVDTSYFNGSPINKEILAYCFARAFEVGEVQSFGASEFSTLTERALWLARDYQDKGIDIKTLEHVERWQQDLASGEQDIYDLSYSICADAEGYGKHWEMGTEAEQATWKEAATREYSNHLTYLIKCYFPTCAVEEMLRIGSTDCESLFYVNAYKSEALVAACKTGNTDIVECLFKKGATLFPEDKDHSVRLFNTHGECLVSNEIQELISQHDTKFQTGKKEIDVKRPLPTKKASIKERLQSAILKSKEEIQQLKDKPNLEMKHHGQPR